MHKSSTLFLLPVTALICSCAVFAPGDRADLEQLLPGQFSSPTQQSFDLTNEWWESFNSAELNELIGEALTNSPSIRQAWARLAQAGSIASRAGASQWPTLNYTASAAADRDSIDKETTEAYAAGLAASYELDLWGRIRSEKEAAALDHDATREQLNTVATTLASQTALRWGAIVAQKLQTEVLRKQVEANRTSLELIELRFRKSQATALDVYQQRQAVAASEQRIPSAERREGLLRNELTALLGRSDFQSLEIAETTLPSIGSLPDPGIPAEVLANRPDVRQTLLNLRSADWSLSAAKADRLPAIRLTASGEYRSSGLSDLFDDWFANLAAGITGPIFEGGRRRAEVERARSVIDERLAAYREVVINAIKEVEDALISEQKQHNYIAALDRNLELSRASYEEALNRYRNGLSEYLPVLVELVNLQTLERERFEAQYYLLQYRINLYAALGGTWPEELISPYDKDEESL